jgi:hypothetical protein
MQVSGVFVSISGMGSCQFPHRLEISAFNVLASLVYFFAVSSEHGNESCHIVEFFVNGMA